MILIKPSAVLIAASTGPEMLRRIEAAGRTCYKSEDKITEDSAEKFVRMIIARGHETVIEHEKVSARVICDRGVSHEIVRHRLASYSQESTRYCDYEGGHVTFIIPPWVDTEPGTYSDRVFCTPHSDPDVTWLHCVYDSELHYKELRSKGWKPEQARSVLPNSLKTELVMTMNLREWRHFFKLRTAPAAHPQMREIADQLLQQMRELIPVVFENI